MKTFREMKQVLINTAAAVICMMIGFVAFDAFTYGYIDYSYIPKALAYGVGTFGVAVAAEYVGYHLWRDLKEVFRFVENLRYKRLTTA